MFLILYFSFIRNVVRLIRQSIERANERNKVHALPQPKRLQKKFMKKKQKQKYIERSLDIQSKGVSRQNE